MIFSMSQPALRFSRQKKKKPGGQSGQRKGASPMGYINHTRSVSISQINRPRGYKIIRDYTLPNGISGTLICHVAPGHYDVRQAGMDAAIREINRTASLRPVMAIRRRTAPGRRPVRTVRTAAKSGEDGGGGDPDGDPEPPGRSCNLIPSAPSWAQNPFPKIQSNSNALPWWVATLGQCLIGRRWAA